MKFTLDAESIEILEGHKSNRQRNLDGAAGANCSVQHR